MFNLVSLRIDDFSISIYFSVIDFLKRTLFFFNANSVSWCI